MNWDKEKVISAFLGQNFPVRGVGTFLVCHLSSGRRARKFTYIAFFILTTGREGPLLSPRNRGSQRLNDLLRVLHLLSVRPRG